MVEVAPGGGMSLPGDLPLRSGDILLTRGLDPLSALLARYGATPGFYSHAALCYRAPDGRPVAVHMQWDGLQAVPINAFLDRYAHTAVVRCRTANREPELTAAIGQWLARNRKEPVLFDPTLRADVDQKSHLFCLNLINRIHDEAGLPAPFTLAQPTPPDLWTARAKDFLGMSIENTPTANSVLGQPEFEVVFRWRNPEADHRIVTVNDALADGIHEAVLQGYVPRPARPASRTLIRAIEGVGMIPANMARMSAMYAVLMNYSDRVHRAVWRRHPRWSTAVPPEDELRAWAVQVTDHYRDEYLYRPGVLP